MARTVEKWPGKTVAAWFDWDWFNGEIWEITRDDLPTHQDLRSARQGIYNISKRSGVPVRTTVVGDSLFIQKKEEWHDDTKDRHS